MSFPTGTHKRAEKHRRSMRCKKRQAIRGDTGDQGAKLETRAPPYFLRVRDETMTVVGLDAADCTEIGWVPGKRPMGVLLRNYDG